MLINLSLVPYPELMNTVVHLTKRSELASVRRNMPYNVSLDARAPGHYRRNATIETHGKVTVDEAIGSVATQTSQSYTVNYLVALPSLLVFVRRKGLCGGVGASVCKVCTG